MCGARPAAGRQTEWTSRRPIPRMAVRPRRCPGRRRNERGASNTRDVIANSAALWMRASKRSRSFRTNSPSPPKPVSKVKSTLTVSRGSPHRCKARPPMKQNCHPWDSQKAWSSAAAWMTSFTAGSLFEPSLLFDQSGSGLWSAGGNCVVGRPAQERDCALGIHIEPAQLLPPQPLQFRARRPPGLHPAATLSDLFGRPISQTRRLAVHKSIVPDSGPMDKRYSSLTDSIRHGLVLPP